jgi:DNA polymerase III sliding clamp (beta) subunit (PCNA family)
MKVNKEQILHQLDSVSPGIATKECVEQSSCFVFQDGQVITFNDEIACSISCDLGFTGAVAAKPLLDLLHKLTEPEIDVSANENELLIKGKGHRKSGITLEAEITLPISVVTQPSENMWRPVSQSFSQAVGVVQTCASKDANTFHLTCIHITQDYIEACDKFQLARYDLNTGLTQECLVKRDSLKHVRELGITEVCETDAWLHFRNPSGLVFSVRREVLDYPDLSALTKMVGEPITLPGGLAEAVDKAQIFSAETTDNVVTIELKQGWLRLRSKGLSGWYEECREIGYTGEPLSFTIAPKMLLEITEKTNECFIVPGRLKVIGTDFEYVTCLGTVE